MGWLYSFVFTDGRMCVNGEVVEGDRRIYHLDLPRGGGLADEIHGTVEGQAVSIPAIDVLGALRDTLGESLWLQSGSMAHLTASQSQPHSRELGRAFLALVQDSLDRGDLADETRPPQYRDSGNVQKRWQADAPELVTPPVFHTRQEAEAWSARRAFASRVGWAFLRVDRLFGDPETYPTLPELLSIVDYFGEAPSATLARAQEVA